MSCTSDSAPDQRLSAEPGMTMRFWEDFDAGMVFEYGDKTVSRAEIVAFARTFDPQPFHTDEDAARRTPYGGLIASGWHTVALFMRLFADNLLQDSSSAGAPGVKRLRWLKPLRPDDRLRVRTTIVEKYPSKSRPEIGFLDNLHELINQDDEVIMRIEGVGMWRRREPGAAP